MPPYSLGDALEFLRGLSKVAPQGFRIGYEGESRRFVQETSAFLGLFLASLVFIYLVLSALFNSLETLIVLISVPLSFLAMSRSLLGFPLSTFTSDRIANSDRSD